ncbi:hypothetical protein [Spiroplasma tabanidicola]|uniref:Uncharacterized protein n=1 Tax=Spiroplasma tabanidicola TaxID=324079 RepID=A0A6I6C931_9MOLU|nr:hypothetical protein [Spiroplasma tabanidicola]QGS51395.1 hypothetical protein STABA_v1c00280 [Spiroplasma tabanidicola]
MNYYIKLDNGYFHVVDGNVNKVIASFVSEIDAHKFLQSLFSNFGEPWSAVYGTLIENPVVIQPIISASPLYYESSSPSCHKSLQLPQQIIIENKLPFGYSPSAQYSSLFSRTPTGGTPLYNGGFLNNGGVPSSPMFSTPPILSEGLNQPQSFNSNIYSNPPQVNSNTNGWSQSQPQINSNKPAQNIAVPQNQTRNNQLQQPQSLSGQTSSTQQSSNNQAAQNIAVPQNQTRNNQLQQPQSLSDNQNNSVQPQNSSTQLGWNKQPNNSQQSLQRNNQVQRPQNLGNQNQDADLQSQNTQQNQESGFESNQSYDNISSDDNNTFNQSSGAQANNENGANNKKSKRNKKFVFDDLTMALDISAYDDEGAIVQIDDLEVNNKDDDSLGEASVYSKKTKVGKSKEKKEEDEALDNFEINSSMFVNDIDFENDEIIHHNKNSKGINRLKREQDAQENIIENQDNMSSVLEGGRQSKTSWDDKKNHIDDYDLDALSSLEDYEKRHLSESWQSYSNKSESDYNKQRLSIQKELEEKYHSEQMDDYDLDALSSLEDYEKRHLSGKWKYDRGQNESESFVFDNRDLENQSKINDLDNLDSRIQGQSEKRALDELNYNKSSNMNEQKNDNLNSRANLSDIYDINTLEQQYQNGLLTSDLNLVKKDDGVIDLGPVDDDDTIFSTPRMDAQQEDYEDFGAIKNDKKALKKAKKRKNKNRDPLSNTQALSYVVDNKMISNVDGNLVNKKAIKKEEKLNKKLQKQQKSKEPEIINDDISLDKISTSNIVQPLVQTPVQLIADLESVEDSGTITKIYEQNLIPTSSIQLGKKNDDVIDLGPIIDDDTIYSTPRMDAKEEDQKEELTKQDKKLLKKIKKSEQANRKKYEKMLK